MVGFLIVVRAIVYHPLVFVWPHRERDDAVLSTVLLSFIKCVFPSRIRLQIYVFLI